MSLEVRAESRPRTPSSRVIGRMDLPKQTPWLLEESHTAVAGRAV